MTILLLFGTRPEAIKMCPLVLELQKRPDLTVRVCVTGQHREMLDEVLAAFGIEPDWDLHVMEPGQSVEGAAARMLTALPAVLAQAAPDLVLVHGDTVSAFAAALACFYRSIPVGHVEAGLRTGRIDAPFPEEFHRRAIALTAKWHFAPTKRARENLLAEGIDPNTVLLTGNTVIDALKTTVREGYAHPILAHPFLLLTAHRRENRGEPLARIFRAAGRILDAHPGLHLLCPVHPAPEVQEAARVLAGHPRAHLTAPLPMVDCHNLLARARLILTDSGGIQEEAAALGRPVLVLREVTERPEGVESGNLVPVGTEEEAIVHAAERLLALPVPAPGLAVGETAFGDGMACMRIAEWVEKTLPGGG